MNESHPDWIISRSGRQFQKPRSVKLSGKLALALNSISEPERRTLLAALLEDLGVDEVVKIGCLQTWHEAVAARREAEPKIARAKAALLRRLAQMIEDSGSTHDMATLSSWLDVWISEPQLELRGATPLAVLGTDKGRQQVEALLERMRGGLPG
ncbi:MAG: DUF2384 domain-containing protein [Burkholderiales bacterium]|nr:DUF2384 domain-containing protein [Burkholderiales bacterium]QIQ10759.1 hypothetical protein FIAIKCIJ_00014 [uncultured bacterium]